MSNVECRMSNDEPKSVKMPLAYERSELDEPSLARISHLRWRGSPDPCHAMADKARTVPRGFGASGSIIARPHRPQSLAARELVILVCFAISDSSVPLFHFFYYLEKQVNFVACSVICILRVENSI
jgi:hypothetical protein